MCVMQTFGSRGASEIISFVFLCSVAQHLTQIVRFYFQNSLLFYRAELRVNNVFWFVVFTLYNICIYNVTYNQENIVIRYLYYSSNMNNSYISIKEYKSTERKNTVTRDSSFVFALKAHRNL